MKIDIDIPDGISGDWSIETFTVREDDLSQVFSIMKSGRGVSAGTYKKLKRNGTLVMSNTPDEIRDFMSFVHRANGHVLVNGLGLGVLLKALLNKNEVIKVTVIEKSQDVINLVAKHYLNDSRVEIINADAFDYKPAKDAYYDAVWHDIWDYITADNLPEMKKLTRKYGRKSGYQASWCRYECEKAEKESKKSYSWY
jgi:hypothetical protein